MAWGNVPKSEAIPFENIVAAQEIQKEEEESTINLLSNEEEIPQEVLFLIEHEQKKSEIKETPTKKKKVAKCPQSQEFQIPIEPEITELTDADYAYALQLQEEQNVKDNRKFRDKQRQREKQELEMFRSRSTKVHIQEDGQTFAPEIRQRTIERELPEEPTKHNHIITSMKASHLFGQFEGMGDIDEAGFLFNQQAIGDLKKKMYKMQREERKKN